MITSASSPIGSDEGVVLCIAAVIGVSQEQLDQRLPRGQSRHSRRASRGVGHDVHRQRTLIIVKGRRSR